MDDPDNAEDEEEEDDYGILNPSSSLSIVREADISGEIRLDSFHFDDLSFDANDFTVTSFRNGHTGPVAVL